MQPDPQFCVQADPYLSFVQFVHSVDTGYPAYGGLENMCVRACVRVCVCATMRYSIKNNHSKTIPDIDDVVTIAGPSGQNVSKVFPMSHCPPFLCSCQSLALTS